MEILSFPYHLYLVISEADCNGRNFLKIAEQAISGGIDIIQLREKNCKTSLFLKKAKQLKEITDRHGIPLIINDNLEVAMQVDSAGIHVGNKDIPPALIREHWKNKSKLIGYSIEYLEQLKNEQTFIADHLGISPIFKTSTKTDTVTEWGLEGIRRIRELSNKPLVAIGNINKKNARSIIQAGADCIAVVSAICQAENPEKAAYELKNEILK
jgi:thiamine-phosphate pyrophosphorylase